MAIDPVLSVMNTGQSPVQYVLIVVALDMYVDWRSSTIGVLHEMITEHTCILGSPQRTTAMTSASWQKLFNLLCRHISCTGFLRTSTYRSPWTLTFMFEWCQQVVLTGLGSV